MARIYIELATGSLKLLFTKFIILPAAVFII